MKIAFLDRDGIINLDNPLYTYTPGDFHWVEGIMESCKMICEAGFEIVVITNQSGIAKGLYTCSDVEALHAYMKQEFAVYGIPILETYYCPHHESVSLCICRKPQSQMVEKALARFGANPENCFFIGDRQRDVDCAQGAGVKGYLVKTNHHLKKVIPGILKNMT
ncbi:MAG: D-glycero-alpha-D-manno-heptose-1,7-bisphosphate 7-phosphatase [Bacteroidota bacterium]|jgi:D-glycero-D-manno-heptose 1,7-bisphosphate phosphatase